MDAGTLQDAIRDAGCPTISTTVNDPNDRATWSFEPKESNTQAQNDIGTNVIATIPIDTLTMPTVAEFVARFTNAEYVLLLRQRATDTAQSKVGVSKDWDIVCGADNVNMNKKKVQTLKTDLVAAAVLTQARADEIFS